MKIDDIIGCEPFPPGKQFDLQDGDVLVVPQNRPVSPAEIASLYSEDQPQWLKDARAEAEKNGDNR